MMPSALRAARRRGYSLMEMIVVLAVVASFLALAMPAVFRPMAKAELRGAARQLEAALLDGRTRAVESGLVQEFHYEPGGRRYEIRARGQPTGGTPTAAPLPAPAPPLPRTAGAAPQPAAIVPEPLSGTLPDGITFADPADERRAEPMPEPAAESKPPAVEESPTGERWATLLCFYPNGRSPNARLKLQGSQSWSVELMLRGLTGTVFVAEPRKRETDQDGSPPQPWSPDRPADSR
jgi:prepilin-type N-terminal cleavage/methylation domain-containing protein